MSTPKISGPVSSASPAVGAAAPKKKSAGIQLLRGSLPRIVGYGLLGLFALDIAQALVGYRPFAPEADANLVLQIIERVGVPLVAYALIFATDTETAPRRERSVLKLLSSGALLGVLVYLILGGLAVLSAYRLVSLGSQVIARQTQERVTALEQAHKLVPTATVQQLFAVYRMMATNIPADAPVPPAAEMIAAIDKGFPPMIQAARDGGANARSQLRKGQAIFGIKYALAGLLSAILFLVIWENTSAVRAHRIFVSKGSPSMKIEDKLVGGFSTLQSSMEDAFFLPTLEKYRWYRRLRRFFGGKR